MSSELNGWVRPRPTRIAFVVQENEHSASTLDAIFADCYSRWGGRFSLIVPCAEGQILKTYWAWLEAFDPDVVYSYVRLNREAILEIHERLNPAEYVSHDLRTREQQPSVSDFRPRYNFEPLSSLSVIFKLSRHNRRRGEPIKIIDSWHTEDPSRFLTDNFGTYHRSQGGGIYPPDATSAARLLTIVSPDKRDRRYGIPADLDVIPDEMEALHAFAVGRATAISVASLLFAPKLEFRVGGWSTSFNLVVGESFADRLLFWNARSLIPGWLDNDLCSLRLGLDQLRNEQFLAHLGELLKRRNHVSSGSGGQPEITIRSVSLTADQLKEALELVQSTRPWGPLLSETIASLEAVVPDGTSLERALEADRFPVRAYQSRDWTRFVWSPPNARPPAEAPDHLSDAPPRQRFIEGCWSNDFIFEHDGPGPVGENRWELPRRWRMAGAFNGTPAGEAGQRIGLPSRRSRHGSLSICISANLRMETIRIPTPSAAIQHALARDGKWVSPGGPVYPSNKVCWMERSNEARYLTGVLGMTGGLRRASQFLLHPFLRKHFVRLGGTPNASSNDLTPTLNRLRKLARRHSVFDIRTEGEREALADLVVKASRELKRPRMFISYIELKDDWKAYRNALSAVDTSGPPEPSSFDWDKHDQDSLDECLVEMRQRQMIFQGHQWTCSRCSHRNWEDLGDIDTELVCEVCREPTRTPIEIRWLFRPNEFLIESLRDHSVLSLVWVLSTLCERARRSLLFVEPTAFGFTDESETPDAEADLLVVLDGKSLLCEAKSSWRALRASDVTDLVSLAKRLRPDIALLAVMEQGGALTSEIDAARAALDVEGIGFELLTPKPGDHPDSPYLYFE
jgi:hypothetical protein